MNTIIIEQRLQNFLAVDFCAPGKRKMVEPGNLRMNVVLRNLEPSRQCFLRAIGAIANSDRPVIAFILQSLGDQACWIR